MAVGDAVYRPGPNDPIPQDERKKYQTQRVSNDLLKEVLAGEKLRQAGSVIEKPSKLPSGMGILGDTIAEVLNTFLNPVENIGSPAKALIAPIANPRLKALFDILRERAPKLVSQAEKASQTVFPYLVPREVISDLPGMKPGQDLLGVLRRSKTLPKSELYVRGGRPLAEQADTAGHELRHFVTGSNPALMAKPAGHALETAQQLTHMMPPAQQIGMQNYLTGVGEKGAAGAPLDVMKLLQGGKQQIGGHAARETPALAFDESLSYLTEALLGGNKGGDPTLEAIAQALGQGLK